MDRPQRPLKKLPYLLEKIRIGLNKDNKGNEYDSINLYFQDESRFGLMTHIGRCLTARGVKPVVRYQHAFKNTYLYGCFSPINGDSFVSEIAGVSSEIFYNYLVDFSQHKPKEYKIVIIDNAGFHSLKNYTLPDNIHLLRIPPYTPELNPAEKIWGYIKQHYKNKVFENLNNIRDWLEEFVIKNIDNERVKSITHTNLYNNAFIGSLDL